MKLFPLQKNIFFAVCSILLLSWSSTAFARLEVLRETRALWVTSMNNIDWPSSPFLSTEEQKKELLSIIELAEKNNLNSIYLQVRPTADALYKKSLEPWSYWLTGKQGNPPKNSYDPLDFAIKECRKRGIEIHAWVNPYRINAERSKNKVIDKHPSLQNTTWLLKYGDMLLFNPGSKEAREYIVNVLTHLVENYDIDGLHLDDYFYPYPIKGEKINDKHLFYKNPRGFDNINDWRRDNVNLFVESLSTSIKSIKPKIKFGVSPFAIWDNLPNNAKGSETKGLSGYQDLYADVLKWIQEKWVDYIVPQLYSSINNKKMPFTKLMDWWIDNSKTIDIYIGLGIYKFAAKHKNHSLKELSQQFKEMRKREDVKGFALYNTTSFKKLSDKHIFSSQNYFSEKVLPHTMLWLDSIPPNPVRSLKKIIQNKTIVFQWQKPTTAKDNEYPSYYGIVKQDTLNNSLKLIRILPHNQYNVFLKKKHYKNDQIGIVAFDRLFNQSKVIFK